MRGVRTRRALNAAEARAQLEGLDAPSLRSRWEIRERSLRRAEERALVWKRAEELMRRPEGATRAELYSLGVSEKDLRARLERLGAVCGLLPRSDPRCPAAGALPDVWHLKSKAAAAKAAQSPAPERRRKGGNDESK